MNTKDTAAKPDNPSVLDQERKELYAKVAELEEDARAYLHEEKISLAYETYAKADGIKLALECVR